MKKIKKILVTLVIMALAANFLVSLGNVGNAFDITSAHDWGEALFGGNQGALSFTSYQGGLAELSDEGYDSALTASGDLKEFILKVVNFALGFLGLIAVLMIIYAGVTYVTSAGQDEKTGNAKKTITYAAIGLLIVLGSFAFVNTIVKSALIGEGGAGQSGAFGRNYGRGFNAIAEEVKGIAIDIYSGYIFLADTTEEFKNIKSDTQKTSLQRVGLPTKATITTFLQGVKGQLVDIRSKTGHLTAVEAAINEKIREIEVEIDKINNITDKEENSYLKSDGTTVYIAKNDWGGWGDFWNGAYEGATGVSVPESEGYIHLDGGLKMLNEWEGYRNGINFDDIISGLGDNFKIKLEGNLDRLMEIYSTVASISAVAEGEAKKYYAGESGSKGMLGDGGTPSTAGIYKGHYGALYNKVKEWTVDAKIEDIAEEALIPGLKAHEKYYIALQAIQFVDARLHADIVEGNAPLTVIFDVGDSVDPAGGSIDNNKIIWDPAGTQTVNGVLSGLPTIKNNSSIGNLNDKGETDSSRADWNVILPKGDDSLISCDYAATSANKDKAKVASGIAVTSRRCTFETPGTYLATVIVNSNDPTKFGPGISVLKIVANPPTTKIELVGKVSNREEKIMHYQDPNNNDDPGNINARQFVITPEEASNLSFDAANTLAESYKWTFGNGEMTEWASSLGTVTEKQFGSFDIGSYQVTLEVTNKAGIIDKKIFNLVIKNVAASFEIVPDANAIVKTADGQKTVMVNTAVSFDGSKSMASKGNKLTNYKWEIYKIENKNASGSGTPINAGDANEGPTKKTYQHTFPEAGWYEVRLTVQGSNSGPNDMDTTTPGTKIKVTSKPPQAVFDYQIPEQTQPGTVVTENLSFDPDNDVEDLEYTWTVTPAQADIEDRNGVKNWVVLNGTVANNEIKDSKDPKIKFNAIGEYEIKLRTHVKTIPDPDEEVSETKKMVNVENILDIGWDTTKQKVSGKINEDMTFYIISQNAVGYEINFGDGESDKGELITAEGIKHQYKQAGKYIVEATVFDTDNNDNSIKKKILIGGGDSPVAYATALINEAEVVDNTIPVEVTRTDKLVFSGIQSINSDGTGRKLKYSWDFGDTGKSSLKEVQHTYSELSPKDKGFYEVSLSVYDENDAAKTSQDTVQLNVCPAPPKYTFIEAKPQQQVLDPVTPVIVNTSVYGAIDPDGEKITKYRWWYFDITNPEEELGMQITTTPYAQLMLGAKGASGTKMEYGIGLEVTDLDGLTYCNSETCKEAMVNSYKQFPTCNKLKALAEKEIAKNYPTIRVTNEQNESPQAQFNVDKVKAFTGEEITFTSSSADSDGQIKDYIWDFEGNGFYDNFPSKESSIKHTYTNKNLQGYSVKLKVVDDKGGEATSEAVTLYIDAMAKAPVAAFKNEVIQGSNGKKIKFTDNSKADAVAAATLIKYEWDFDLNTDSDGDGNKTNDVDSDATNPEHLFDPNGTYKVKLTVTDDQGNTDDVENEVKIPLANPPVAAFNCEMNNNIITCHDISTADTAGDAEIASRVWDFDTTSILPSADTNGDGNKSNDEDSKDANPTYTYASSGMYRIKLTVTDNQGNLKELFKDINVAMTGGTSTVGANSSDGTGSSADTTTTTTTTTSGNQSTGNGMTTGIAPKDENTPPTLPQIPEIKPVLKITILKEDGKTEYTPTPDADGIIYVSPKEMVRFDFSKSQGSISEYEIDKNIHYNIYGNNVSDSYKTDLGGVYQTSFKPEEGNTNVVKLTVRDIHGNEQSAPLQTIKLK